MKSYLVQDEYKGQCDVFFDRLKDARKYYKQISKEEPYLGFKLIEFNGENDDFGTVLERDYESND